MKLQRKNIGQALLGLLILSSIFNVKAAGLVLEMGLHTGGDKLAQAVYTNGDTSSIYAGSLFSFAIGGGFDVSDNLEGRLTVGYKVDQISASNGDIKFGRVPINALLLYKLNKLRLGGGLTYHLSPKLDGSGVASGVEADFDDAMGVLLELDYYVNEKVYIGGRYTSIEYESIASASVRRATVDGSSIGIVAGVRF